MVDQLTPNAPQPEAPDAPKRGFSAYVSSSAGRVVVIAIAIGVLLVVAGITAVVFLNYGTSSSDGTDTAGATAPAASKVASSSASDDETATPADPVPDSAVFTFRDIFQRPITSMESTATTGTASVETSGSSSSSTTTSSTTSLDPDTLYLQDIVSVNDVPKAVLALNGKTYTLAEGGRISGTPWEVMDIRATAVTMLYGDVKVVLSVGQGMLQQK